MRIFSEKISGSKAERPRINACLAQLKKGDTLLVWRLDHLGRSMPHLVGLVESLRQRGVGFLSLCDGVIDTTTASGELVFNIFSYLVQFERRLMQERTRAGLSAARARGKTGRRKPITANNPRVKIAKTLYEDKRIKINVICKLMQIARSTFYRLVKLNKEYIYVEVSVNDPMLTLELCITALPVILIFSLDSYIFTNVFTVPQEN